ncbi:metal ABC transporter substrate-binding protein [Thermobifida alba]|uniref:Metal ABC transporter substrate-binding protein n=1 Tax=Thermobifida alba TaxID=53522 RepID=A0ABY4L048_THEAE|nr:metal ABC transporter substrate-binding protein [Thermobifida alba]UPT20849.1 metal ABC transporter substrate-binding protein [Thermobifida alba]HLU95480.1 metal ABC transporter substrate-binding protein [Thermobifida alba]
MTNFEDRRAFRSVVAGVLLCALTACGLSTAEQVDDGRPVVLTTFTVLADMVRNVAGDHVRVESITRVGAEIHEYDPTPSDLVRAQAADLVLANGMNLELWFRQFTDPLDVPTRVVTEGVETIPVASGGYAGKPNPHAWMSPDEALVYVDNIRAALSDLDPDHAADYAANAEAYRAEITEIGEFLRTELATLPEHQRVLVTCEGAFSYLARDTGLTEKYLWPMNSDGEGTPQQIASVVEFVREHEVPAVFCESTVNDDAQRQVARETGAVLGEALYVDSLSDADGPVPTYLDLLRHDARAIVAGLTGEGDRP